MQVPIDGIIIVYSLTKDSTWDDRFLRFNLSVINRPKNIHHVGVYFLQVIADKKKQIEIPPDMLKEEESNMVRLPGHIIFALSWPV